MKNTIYSMLSNIKNGQLARKQSIYQSKTKKCEEILNILWDEGFILGYKKRENELVILLGYKNNSPLIKTIKNISKPNLKVYYSVKQLWKLNNTNGLLVFSTNRGLLSINTCKKLKIGGEPILIIK